MTLRGVCVLSFMSSNSNSRLNLKGLWLEDFQKLLADRREKPFRAKQLASWIYNKRVSDFSRMTDVSKSFREQLAKDAYVSDLKIVRTEISKDKSIKFLFELEDKETIEAVFIKEKGRNTICISSQVGCPLACAFCATGYMGYKRNLTAGEIVDQIIQIKKNIPKNETINNIVFMGMGEPFLNYDNVLKALRIMTSDLGLGISPKRITVSTAGVTDKIYQLAQDLPKVKLAISLHSPEEELRKKLMPITKKFPLKPLLEAGRFYAKNSNQRITFEYVLIKGVNDTEEIALKLAKSIQGIPCKINLILYNPIADADFERPSMESVNRFREILYPRAPAVTLRISKGVDIQAACGQLKTKTYRKSSGFRVNLKVPSMTHKP